MCSDAYAATDICGVTLLRNLTAAREEEEVEEGYRVRRIKGKVIQSGGQQADRAEREGRESAFIIQA